MVYLGASPPTPPPSSKAQKMALIIGLAVTAGGIFFLLILVILFFYWRQKSTGKTVYADDMEGVFRNGAGPKRFDYDVLAAATGNFSGDRKLGEGGFGSVYRGFIDKLNLDVAIKRVSRSSTQGWKEYASEVKIISVLRHRNLVKLIGWYHNHDELLLVYELMLNGSLDKHLYSAQNILSWQRRSPYSQFNLGFFFSLCHTPKAIPNAVLAVLLSAGIKSSSGLAPHFYTYMKSASKACCTETSNRAMLCSMPPSTRS